MYTVKNNNENETYTYIAIPLPVMQQNEQQQQNVYVEQNVILKTLANGATYVIDTNHFLNSQNSLQLIQDNNQFSQESIQKTIETDPNAFNDYDLQISSNAKSLSVVRKPGRPRKTDENSSVNQSNSFDKTKTYFCDVCCLSFNLLSNYNLHKSTHDRTNNKCPECNKKFSRLASLRAHVVLHMKEETVTCEKCEKEFETEQELKTHMKRHAISKISSAATMTCRYCQMEFQESAEYKKHMAQHNKLRNVLNSSRHAKKKTKRSDKVLKHQCEVCKKSFQKLSQIERHMRIHNGEKPFVCATCNKSFTQKCSLQIHMARHTGSKPYKCTLCPATCSQRGNLKMHVLKTHSVSTPGENVFRCNKCSCVFKKLGTLNGHITKNHPEQTIVTGDQETMMTQLKELQKQGEIDEDILQQALSNSGLPATVKSEINAADSNESSGGKRSSSTVATFVTLADTNLDGNIKRYVVKQRKVGDVRWHMCMYCIKEFKKPSDLVRHLRVHTRERPYKCKQCYRSFAVKSTLTTHIKTHIGSKEYKCVMCSKICSTLRTLNVHMRSHNVYKPLSCTLCQKLFQSASLLKMHLQTHMMVDEKLEDPDMNDQVGVESEIIDIVNEQNHSNRLELMQQPIIVTTKGLMSVGVPLKKRPIIEYLSKSRPHKCFKCPAAFRKLTHLKHHMATHSTTRKFKCDVCSKHFKSQSILKSHERTHENLGTAFMCIECKKNFSSGASLKRHMLTHNSQSPFLCPFCYRCFKTVLVCRKHIKICTDRSHAAVEMTEFDMEKQTLEEAENEQVAELTAAATLHYQPDLMDSIADEPFVIHNGGLQQQGNSAGGSSGLLPGSLLVSNAGLGDENGGQMVLSNGSGNVDDNIQQIEETISEQLFMDNLTAVNELMAADAAKGGGMSLPCTTDELVSTLEGTGAAGVDSATGAHKNDQLHFGAGYPTHIYVGLQPNDPAVNQFMDGSFDNNLLKFQHDPMLLEDMNALAAQDNTTGGMLPNLGGDIHQQLIIMPQDIVDAPMSLQTETPQYALDPSLTLIPSSVSGMGQNVSVENGTDMNGFDLGVNGNGATLQGVATSALEAAASMMQQQQQNQARSANSATSMLMCSICKTDFKSTSALKSHQCFNISVTSINDIKNGIAAVENALMPTDKNVVVGNRGIQADDWINPELLLNRVPDKSMQDISVNIPNLTANGLTISAIGGGKTIGSGGKQQCPYCPKSFKKPSDLQRHIRTHTGEKPFVCCECGKGFSLKSTLDCHSKLHQGRKDVVCTVCDNLFTTKGSLKVHMRLHTGARPYKCDFCDEVFRTTGHRKSHTMSHFRAATHSVKRPKEVNLKQSKLNSMMSSAVKMELALPQEVTELPEEANMATQEQMDPIIDHFLLENNITDLSNTYLQFDLVTKDDLAAAASSMVDAAAQNKILTTHTIPLTALLDEKSQRELELIFQQQQQQHQQQLTAKANEQRMQILQENPYVFPCDACGKSFKTKGTLQRHKKIHYPDTPIKCEECGKSFPDKETFDVHMKVHAGERPFKCDYCSNSFCTRGHLKTHMRRMHGIICADLSADPQGLIGSSIIDGSLL